MVLSGGITLGTGTNKESSDLGVEGVGAQGVNKKAAGGDRRVSS